MTRNADREPEDQAVALAEPPSAGLPRRPRLASDGVWLIAGQAATALATLAGVRVLTEMVAPEVYGSVTLIAGVLLLGRNLFCFPFYQAALRFFPEVAGRGEAWRLRRVLFSFLMKSSTLLAGLIVVSGAAFCTTHRMPLILVPVMVGLLYVDVFRTMETDLLNAARRQRPFSILRAAEAWARPLVAALIVWRFGPSPVTVLSGYLLASGGVLASIFLFRVDRVGVGVEGAARRRVGEEDRVLGERLWRFSLPLIPLAVLEWTASLSDRYLISGLIGLEAAGIYVAAYGLVSQPFLMSSGVLEMLFRPVYFEALASGDRPRARKVFLVWLAACVAVCAAGVVAVTLLRGPITVALLAERYRSSSALLPWIALGNAMFAVGMVFEKLFHARHRTELVLVSRVVGAVLSVAVGVPMILAWGVFGAAVAVPVYYGCQLAVSVAMAARVSRRSIDSQTLS